ncbi:MAG: diguanylate cyclase [Acidobacteriota bacterium]|nr:diguanylate cyclase [Acidobacteriota bacterium]
METPGIALYLTWTEGEETKSHSLGGEPIIIGRSPRCNLGLDNPNVSRLHARIFEMLGAYYIEDMGSSFGTYLDHDRLQPGKPYKLAPGSEIKLGSQTLWCLATDAQAMRSVELTSNFYVSTGMLNEIEDFKRNMLDHCTQVLEDESKQQQLLELLDKDLRSLDSSLKARLQEHRVLHEISAVIGRILDIDELLATVLSMISEVLQAERGLVLSYDPREDLLLVKIARYFNEEDFHSEKEVRFSKSVARQCLQQRRIVLVSDAVNNATFKVSDSISTSRVRSVACIPLMQKEEVLGILYLDNRNQPGCFGEDKIDFLKILAVQVTNALVNARLYTQATTDDLTGLYSRNFMENHILEEIRRADRYSRDCSLLMVDLDHFKRINDTLGHQSGDVVLRRTARTIEDNIREVDMVGRYGGEEFMVLLPETGLDDASALAERIRLSLEKMSLQDVHQDLKVTGSIGVAAYHPGFKMKLRPFVEAADQALYHAKENGRNQVITADNNPMLQAT